MCKKGSNPGKEDANKKIAFWLKLGIIIAFALFVGCIGLYIASQVFITWSVRSLLINVKHIDAALIEILKDIQAYFKDSSNYNIVNLIYTFITAVLIGCLAMFVQNQKSKIDSFETKVSEKHEEMKALGDTLTTYNVTKDILQKLNLAVSFVSEIATVSTISHDEHLISLFSVKYRDYMGEIKKHLEKQKEQKIVFDKNEMVFLATQLCLILDLLQFAQEHGISGIIVNDLNKRCNDCLDLLQQDG
ncbi:MAG: hypothetical protein FWH55_12905 [Oscillospiraceae bacterium]|nr:hypothetical protein [Oscillospiraceae bacterium]